MDKRFDVLKMGKIQKSNYTVLGYDAAFVLRPWDLDKCPPNTVAFKNFLGSPNKLLVHEAKNEITNRNKNK